MKTIGITGGIGAGKSEVTRYIEKHYNAKVIYADEVAHLLEKPGHECYAEIVKLLGKDILDSEGFIVNSKMAEKIFNNDELKGKVNEIIHPAVKKYILETIESKRQAGDYDYLVVEAALLLEEGYKSILDELWYVRADEDIRRERLRNNRGYSDAKIDAIFAAQLSDEAFINNCDVVIDNSKTIVDFERQIDEKMLANIKD